VTVVAFVSCPDTCPSIGLGESERALNTRNEEPTVTLERLAVTEDAPSAIVALPDWRAANPAAWAVAHVSATNTQPSRTARRIRTRAVVTCGCVDQRPAEPIRSWTMVQASPGVGGMQSR